MFRGSCLKHLDFDEFKALQIPIPSLEKQKEIISRYEEYDNKIHQNEQLIQSLEAQKSVLADEFVRSVFLNSHAISHETAKKYKVRP
mgnify:CR=1 FL=1